MTNLGKILSFAVSLAILFWVFQSRTDFKPADPQAAAGSWTIEVQVPPCDNGNLQLNLPEREGDVVTIYCKTFAVKER